MILFGKLKLATIRVAPVAVAAVAMTTLLPLTGCRSAVKTDPSFSPTDLTILVGGRPIERLALIDGQPIDPITFPEAKGGSGALTYSLTPDVPGLKFDPATRVWSGTPTGARTAARTHDLTYTATGADGASASVQFAVTVRPTLWGTWRSVSAWRDWRDDEDRVVGEFVETLTFTRDRYIYLRAYYDLSGELSHNWEDSGPWSQTDTTITRTWLEDHDDDDDTPYVVRSVAKDYLWPDEMRNVLMVHIWDDDEAAHFQEFRRVDTTLPPPITGVWIMHDGEDDYTVTMTVNEDHTLVFTQQERAWTSTETAKWVLDQDRYYLDLTEATDDDWNGGRIAFAPTDKYPDAIAVSAPWDEDRAEYGNYWMTFVRSN